MLQKSFNKDAEDVDVKPALTDDMHILATTLAQDSECTIESFPGNLVPDREYGNSDVQRAI